MQDRIHFNARTLLAFSHDVFASGVAWFGAYWLRLNLELPEPFLTNAMLTSAWVIPLQAFIFWRFGLYRGVWRYASLPDLKRIMNAVGVAALAIPMMLVLLQGKLMVPRSVFLLDPILLLMLMGGSRLAYRAWKEHRLYGIANLNAEPVFVVGTGDAAANLVRELGRSQVWRVVGLFDDNEAKSNRLLHGIRVLGGLDKLTEWSHKLDATHAIIAMPAASHQARRQAVEMCAAAGLKVLTVPSFDDLMSGKVTVSEIRNIEVEDLLGRDPVVLDDEGLHHLLTNRVVMVTGAGGSIGSELCRQIAKFEPSLLVLSELNEFALYQMEQAFLNQFPGVSIVCAIGDVKDLARMEQIIQQFRPSVIFHAAAYKHVPLMENENAWQAVRNNVLGTYAVAQAAITYGVEKFILISTDKAVNPTNVMGATKRLAEMVCQGLQGSLSHSPSPRGVEGGATGTRFVMVRFGNVLGSTGSVIPKFQEQIAHGGPITVTHPEITRYFMSIPEAAQLVLQAGLMGEGGEIFVLDMGEPVRIVELAKDMIRLSGFSEGDIPIVFTGLRPGEKLYEELLADDEHTLPTPHPKLRIAQARTADDVWLDALLEWAGSGEMLSEQEVKQGLMKWVPEYISSKNS